MVKLALLFAFIIATASAAVASDVQFDKGVAAFKRGDYADAVRAFGISLQTNPNNPGAYYYLANCYRKSNQVEDARKVWSVLIQRFPTSNEAKAASKELAKLPAGNPQAIPRATTAAAASTRLSEPTRPAPDLAGEDDDRQQPNDLAGLPDEASFYFNKEGSGHMAVVVSMDGHPVNAWFDTGASCFFDKADLKTAGIDLSKAVSAPPARGWAGKSVPSWYVLANVKLGNLTRRLPVRFQEGGGEGLSKGLIGQDFVHGYQYDIDDAAGRITMHKGGGSIAHVDSLYDVPCTFEANKDVVNVRINGQQTQAFIDTGASSTIIDSATAELCHIDHSGKYVTMSGVGGMLSVEVASIKFQVGPVNLPEATIYVGGHAGTCIGQDLMNGWRCKVDREHHLLRFFH